MVLIEDITDQRPLQPNDKAAAAMSGNDPSSSPPPPPTASAAEDNEEAIAAALEESVDVLPSDERSLDAAEIEQLAAQLRRPTAKLHVSALVTKLHREAEALQRMEKARKLQQSPSKLGASERKVPAVTATTDENRDPVVAPGGASASSTKTVPPPAAAVLLSPPPVPLPAASASASVAAPSLGAYYVPIDRFAFDAGGYNAPFVTLYVELPGVGSIPRDSITCHFTKSTVDLVVRNLQKKSYRLYKDNLDKDIDPSKSKIVVKANKVLVKLAKIKSEYGSYDYWTQLTAKKAKTKANDGKADDPSASIMQLMRDMYEDGDDNMRKVIGETMLKQQRGELGKDKDSMMGGGFGGGGGMGGLKDDDEDDF